ncbi:hypothetical protein CUMW_186840 [Citrus unshiu]|nr:hypothetical protein CUMW_186840 [Citrus unshiu]
MVHLDIEFIIPNSRPSVVLQDKKIISLSVRKAASQFIDDVPSSECAAPHGPHYFQKAALDFTRSLDDVPLSEYHAKARRFQEFVDDIGSTIKGHDLKIPKQYVSHDDDDSKDHPISIIMEPVYNVSPNGKFRRRITSWQKGELLGSGSFGSVYEGLTDDGFFFAVKEVSLRDEGPRGKQSILQLDQEISLLSQFEHDNIVQYLGTDKDENRLYVFLELVTRGSLANLYQKYHLSDSQVSSYTRQILNGLTYLHERNVVHRDIKCANILVDAGGSATTMNDVKSRKGTPFWMAPEVVNSKNDGYALTADIWSLGCTVLEMLTRRPPYSHLEGMQALFRIGRGELPSVPSSLSRDARDFILKCLQVNSNDRPTATQLMEHPFVKRPLQTSSAMRKQLSELWNSKDFDDGQKIGSEKTLRRWRSPCNGRRSFHKLAGPDDRLKLQSNEDVPSSEYIVTEADTQARRFQQPIDDDGSTISGLNVMAIHAETFVPHSKLNLEYQTKWRLRVLQKQVRVSAVVLKAVLHFTESLSLRSNEDVPTSEYIVTEAATEARIFQEPVDDVGSTVNDLEIFKLLGEYEKRALAVFYLVLEATSFLLDIFGKSKKSILLAAFLLSAFGFAITMSTHVRRNIAATGMHLQKRLLMVLEISFSLVQLIVTLIYFILAELGVKNNFNTSVFPLVFAIIAAVFTFKYDGEVTDSSGLDSALVALAAGSQVHMPNITGNEDPEANGCMPMLADFR